MYSKTTAILMLLGSCCGNLLQINSSSDGTTSVSVDLKGSSLYQVPEMSGMEIAMRVVCYVFIVVFAGLLGWISHYAVTKEAVHFDSVVKEFVEDKDNSSPDDLKEKFQKVLSKAAIVASKFSDVKDKDLPSKFSEDVKDLESLTNVLPDEEKRQMVIQQMRRYLADQTDDSQQKRKPVPKARIWFFGILVGILLNVLTIGELAYDGAHYDDMKSGCEIVVFIVNIVLAIAGFLYAVIVPIMYFPW